VLGALKARPDRSTDRCAAGNRQSTAGNDRPRPLTSFVRSSAARPLRFLFVGGITFVLQWNNITAPILGHIHRGAAGVTGPVVVPFFMTAVPAGIFALAGTVPNVDPALARQIRAAPRDYYVNLHTAEFPAGAVRGQLHG